nr:XRE family transcriptional regulator [uncultured Blautia sp.]
MKDIQYVGNKVNELRKQAGLTLKELGEKTDLSQGYLSKFERGQTTISLDSLMTIAKALNTTMDKLFPTETSEHEDNWEHVVHRSYENSVLYMENTKHINYQITHNLNMDMFPKISVLLPSPNASKSALFAHKGEEFVYVLEGILTLKIQDKTYELYPGDTAHFRSDVEHIWYNNTNMTTKILTLHTPNVLRNHCDDALPIDIIHS